METSSMDMGTVLTLTRVTLAMIDPSEVRAHDEMSCIEKETGAVFPVPYFTVRLTNKVTGNQEEINAAEPVELVQASREDGGLAEQLRRMRVYMSLITNTIGGLLSMTNDVHPTLDGLVYFRNRKMAILVMLAWYARHRGPLVGIPGEDCVRVFVTNYRAEFRCHMGIASAIYPCAHGMIFVSRKTGFVYRGKADPVYEYLQKDESDDITVVLVANNIVRGLPIEPTHRNMLAHSTMDPVNPPQLFKMRQNE